VRSLVLGCTASGGPHAVQAGPEALEALTSRGLDPDAATEAIIPFLYDPATPRERIDQDMVIRKKWYPTLEGFLAQLQAIIAWEAYSRLPQIVAPALVIHGDSDRLVPPANGRMISERIPGAKLVMLPHAGHIFLTDQEEAAQQAVLEFLSAQPDGQPRR